MYIIQSQLKSSYLLTLKSQARILVLIFFFLIILKQVEIMSTYRGLVYCQKVVSAQAMHAMHRHLRPSDNNPSVSLSDICNAHTQSKSNS